MKILQQLIILIILILMPSFKIYCFGIPKGDQLVYSSMKEISYQLQRKYGLTGGFCGCGKDSGGFWKVIFFFDRYGCPLTIDESRELIISCSEIIINFVNQNPEIEPYLRDYPFSQYNVQVFLTNHLKDKKDVYHPYIRSVTSASNRLNYSTYEASSQYKRFTETKETYVEGLAKLRKQNCENEKI